MASDTLSITHVSDTAMWVAQHRADESARPNALFNDPYARTLAGVRGAQIVEQMRKSSRFSEWTVSIRTAVIDSYIRDAVAQGIDTFVNLGAGLDTRPYRMALPANIRWIEVDYPSVIDYKAAILAPHKPTCSLERIRVDLADDAARQDLFRSIAKVSSRILVITEGVLPYLTEDQLSALARDLHEHPSLCLWIAEFFAKRVYPILDNPKRRAKMKNAPFRFFPDDWFAFFRKSGWEQLEMRYLGEASVELGRRIPMPRWMAFMRPFLSKANREEALRFTGYVLFRRA